VDYWAVDFDDLQRKEIIKVPAESGLSGITSLPGFGSPQGELAVAAFEEHAGPGAISSRMNGKFSARARTRPSGPIPTEASHAVG
jgi:hypothetical protein